MIYIIGSGFSGLVTAFALSKKHKNITIITPSKNKKINKSLTLIKYLFNFTGEVNFNSKTISDQISNFETNKYKNCKFISSYQDGGLSNIWGGVLSNIYKYNLKRFPFKTRDIKKVINKFIKLEKIIFDKNFKNKSDFGNVDDNLSLLKFNRKNNNIDNLKKFLLTKNINFKYNLYLKKIYHKKKIILLQDLLENKEKTLSYQKVYIATGPINTAKIILNSFNNFRSIKLYETRHFFCFVKKNSKFSNVKYLNFKFKNIKFYSQLYGLSDIVKLFINFKKFNFFKNFFIAQCYLDTKDSGYIEIKKIGNSKFSFTGKEKVSSKKKIMKAMHSYNIKSKSFKFYFPIMNSIGSSNHLGASFPMSKNKGKYKTTLNGQLYGYKDVFISDSSVLNEVDMQPITTFSLLNILRMNSKIL